jgi:hypothetical protein
MARQPLGGLGRLIFRGFTITLIDTLHSVGLLWTRDQRWRSWLRHFCTKRNVVGSIPDGVIEIFH